MTLIISAMVCLCAIGVRNIGWFEFLELAAYDYCLRFTAPKTPMPPPIVLINISEEDINKLGRWPVSDANLAVLLKKLGSFGPRAMGLDLYRDIPVPPGSSQLVDVFSRAQSIVTVKKIGDDKSSTIKPPYMVKNMDLVGFNDIVVDTGGIVRRGLLFMDDGETAAFSFALQLSLLYLGPEGITPEPGEQNEQHLRLGKTTFVPLEANDGGYIRADARGYQFLLDFKEASTPFTSFSLTEALSGKVPAEAVRDKIVLIGVTAESLKDFFYTPFSRVADSEQKMPGHELHARIASQIIRSALKGDKPMRYISEVKEWSWIVLWGLVGGLLGLWGRSLTRLFLFGLFSLSVLVSVCFVVFRLGWWVPVVPPAAAWLVSGAVVAAYNSYHEKIQRDQVMQLFSRHVSPDVANAIWQNKEDFMDGARPRPQKLTATVLFTDIKGFTSVSEKMDPPTLLDWLNEYMEAMAQVVISHGGIINKYIGDAIMAVFGIPVARTTDAEIGNDAAKAVECALSMADGLEALNKEWQARGLATIKMRVGIYTGELVAGSLGSSQRMEYTVIGDTVNIASRLESFDKDSVEIGADAEKSVCRILIGEGTARYVGDRFLMKKVGAVSLKGKDEKITIYMVYGKSA